MIRWKIEGFLQERRWSPYRLAAETRLSLPAAYRLMRDESVKRIDGTTLGTLCGVFGCQPGDLLEYLPDEPPEHVPTKRRGRR